MTPRVFSIHEVQLCPLALFPELLSSHLSTQCSRQNTQQSWGTLTNFPWNSVFLTSTEWLTFVNMNASLDTLPVLIDLDTKCYSNVKLRLGREFLVLINYHWKHYQQINDHCWNQSLFIFTCSLATQWQNSLYAVSFSSWQIPRCSQMKWVISLVGWVNLGFSCQFDMHGNPLKRAGKEGSQLKQQMKCKSHLATWWTWNLTH